MGQIPPRVRACCARLLHYVRNDGVAVRNGGVAVRNDGSLKLGLFCVFMKYSG